MTLTKSWFFGALLVGILTIANGSCPNHCNSNGVCDKFSRCTCSVGFQGADCSERICPFGLAWSDEATDTDTAHGSTECSNRGVCDRSNGKCTCMEGFTGSSCERLNCHDDCNGKGICFSMRDFAGRTRNELSISYEYDTVWDADKIKGCSCDNGLSGYDCSLVKCPDGDDPLTTGQYNEVQLLKCTANQGTFVLYYNGKPSRTISHNANAAAVKAALVSIPGLTGVKVTFSQAHGTVCQLKTNIVSIEFITQFGEQNPLVPFLSPVLTDNGGTLIISADGVSVLTDVSLDKFKSVRGTKEADICANRGLCNRDTGTCSCFNTNGDAYDSSDGYGNAGIRGDCGFVESSSSATGVSTCPGELQCSGHGVCDQSTYRCSCSSGWQGGDCSEKVCPLGKSWFDYPSADNAAHNTYTVCSNMGICDYTSGACTCREGFYGGACEYMACGGGVSNPCNGNGRCMTMAELALWANSNGDATEYVYGSDPNDLSTWDHDRVHGCLCDEGFGGYDCSLKQCPRGDDPGTYEDHVEVQLLQCVADGGNFTLSFRQAVTSRMSFNVSAIELQASLSALKTIGRVNVYFAQDGPPPNGTLNYVLPSMNRPLGLLPADRFSNVNGTYRKFHFNNTALGTNSSFCKPDGFQVAVIEFTYTHGDLPAIIPDVSNLGDYTHYNGEPGSGAITVFTDGASVFDLQSIRGTTETDICNNRGLCDTSTGLCHCFDTWTSSDGGRQGNAGNTRDCGYRNDKLYSFSPSG